MKKLKALVDGDLTDPIINNGLVFIATYGIVVLSCVFIIRESLDKNSCTYLLDILQIISDSLIPTTITFSIGVIIQNIAVVISNRITRCVWLIMNLIATFFYVFYYSINHVIGSWQKAGGLFLFSAAILMLCFVSLSQIRNHIIELNKRSLSG